MQWNGRSAGRLPLHGTINRIPALRAGMPPFGTTSENRGAPPDVGGDGAGLGEARQGNQSERLSLATLIGLPLGVVLLCQAEPYLRHLQQGGARFRVLDGIGHIQALLGVATISCDRPMREGASCAIGCN